jgi:hypothetical protein
MSFQDLTPQSLPQSCLRLDDRRSSRVCKIYNYAGLNEKEKWDKLQNEMIDDMIKLEKAFKKYINTLKI